jgi:ParB family chromosome partitioning protein
VSKLSLAVERQAARPAQDPAETAIARLAQADRALAEAIEVADAVHLVGTAKALKEWATAVHAGKDHERQAAVFVLRAVRNAGERIAAAQARGEVATQGHHPGSITDAETAPATLAEIGVTHNESSEWKRLAAEYPTDEALAEAAETLERPTLSGALALPHVARNSGDNEWYTPAAYIDAARAAMGGIDLDPASSHEANKVVGAAAIFTAEDNGLEYGWRGRVWMNPPYAQPLVSQFCSKLADEYEAGNVEQACVLVNNATETGWYQALARRAASVCFPLGRVRFWQPGAATGAPLQGQAVLYLGPDPERFASAFSTLGLLYERKDVAA